MNKTPGHKTYADHRVFCRRMPVQHLEERPILSAFKKLKRKVSLASASSAHRQVRRSVRVSSTLLAIQTLDSKAFWRKERENFRTDLPALSIWYLKAAFAMSRSRRSLADEYGTDDGAAECSFLPKTKSHSLCAASSAIRV